VLRLDDVHVAYGEIPALKGVALEVRQGEIVALLGNNGAGKTTTLRTISGLLVPSRGTLTLEEQPLVGRPSARGGRAAACPRPRRRADLQSAERAREPHDGRLHAERHGRDRERPRADLRAVPRLLERVTQVAGTLSGGEQQMLAIGRALMARPALLLLDEPSMGLAPVLVEQIFDTVRDINAQGTTILLVEQNAAMALSVASAAT
jgi:branched-chain amino acid transport system ATP-binding protein